MTFQNVLVTGAAGHLGSALVRHLSENGMGVVAQGLAEGQAEPASLNVTPFNMDLAQSFEALPFLPRIDAVVHCYELREGSRKALQRENVLGTQNALAIAKASGARRFIYISTAQVYSKQADQGGVLEVQELPRPLNYYARSKRSAEMLVQSDTGVQGVILRAPIIYGPGESKTLGRLMSLAERRAMPLIRNGLAQRDVIHIDDAIQAILAALNVQTVHPGSVFNIASDEPMPISDIVESAALSINLDVHWERFSAQHLWRQARRNERAASMPFRSDPPVLTRELANLLSYHQTMDISAAAAQFDWQPGIRWQEGIKSIFSQCTVTYMSRSNSLIA